VKLFKPGGGAMYGMSRMSNLAFALAMGGTSNPTTISHETLEMLI